VARSTSRRMRCSRVIPPLSPARRGHQPPARTRDSRHHKRPRAHQPTTRLRHESPYRATTCAQERPNQLGQQQRWTRLTPGYRAYPMRSAVMAHLQCWAGPARHCSGHRRRRQPLHPVHRRKASNSARRGSDLSNFVHVTGGPQGIALRRSPPTAAAVVGAVSFRVRRLIRATFGMAVRSRCGALIRTPARIRLWTGDRNASLAPIEGISLSVVL